MNDVIINKVQTIQRCVRRAREEYQADAQSFASNFTRQDAAILNVVRACETAIDLANYVIRTNRLGIPVSSADVFKLLHAANIIDGNLAERMQKMVGFRNTVVHQYSAIDMRIVESVITKELDELLAFAESLRQHMSGSLPQ